MADIPAMNSPVILRAVPDDAPEILSLQRLAYQSEALLYNDWNIPPLLQTLPQLLEEFHGGVVLKAVGGGSVLGSVRGQVVEDIVQVGRLIVAPSVQRQGLGSALLRAIELAFPASRRFELFTGSRSEGNIRLYRAHGYVHTHEKVLSPNVTVVFMSKAREAATGPTPT